LFTAVTIFKFLQIGAGKKETSTKEFMETFHKNCTEEKRQSIANIEMIFSDESFLISNLIIAVLMMILAFVFGDDFSPYAKVQFFMSGDPFQLLVWDKSKLLAKCKCAFMDVIPFETVKQIFSKFFECLMITGLRVIIITKIHRQSDEGFIQLCNKVNDLYL